MTSAPKLPGAFLDPSQLPTALETDQAARDLKLDDAGEIRDGLITGIGSEATARGRSRRSRPGECYRRAGWTEIDHAKGRADVWLGLLESDRGAR
jgi:hypothetical protein